MNVEVKLIAYIRDQLVSESLPELTADSNLIADGVLDSTALMQIVLWIEDEFDIAVDVEDMTPENFGTVRNMAEYLRNKGPSEVTQG